MRRCRCCRQRWPTECFKPNDRCAGGRVWTCRACRTGCHGTRYAKVKAYRVRLRADVLAVRAARAA